MVDRFSSKSYPINSLLSLSLLILAILTNDSE